MVDVVDVGVHVRMILKWILIKYTGVVWTRFTWFRIGTCDVFL
jgi:hypothetical protein